MSCCEITGELISDLEEFGKPRLFLKITSYRISKVHWQKGNNRIKMGPDRYFSIWTKQFNGSGKWDQRSQTLRWNKWAERTRDVVNWREKREWQGRKEKDHVRDSCARREEGMGETQKGEGRNNTENGEGEGTNAVKLAATQNQLLEGRRVTIKEKGNGEEEREMQWMDCGRQAGRRRSIAVSCFTRN